MILKKAESQLAYELQAAKIKQKIRSEEIQIDVVERRKMIEVEEQEIKRKDKELMGTVKLPAEAEAHRLEQIAIGKRLAFSKKKGKLRDSKVAVLHVH